jgi:amino acid adenylation domain-containing protein
LIEEQAELRPDAVAVVCGEDSVTYGELNARANQLAHYLRRRGVGEEKIIGVFAIRSPETIVAILGVLKAGGAYLPLDPSHPAGRLQLMLAEAGARLLLLSRCSECSAGELLVESVDLEEDWHEIECESTLCPGTGVTLDHLAYVIYTSGSSGKPKGVMLQHRGLMNFVQSQVQELGIADNCRVLQFASLSFDASITEIFPVLLKGGVLCLAAHEQLLGGAEMERLMERQQITVAVLPPSVLNLLSSEKQPALKTVLSVGEACNQGIARRWSTGRRLFNGYGPTEATVGPLLFAVQQGDAERMNIPVGRPIANTQAYLLNSCYETVGTGIAGEIVIGGSGVARGYLNQPELTAERFIPDLFGRSGARLYRTGDVGRRLPDGNIEYVTRMDEQVKIRGYRIEPGEIEMVLRQHPAVQDVCVVVTGDDGPGKKLTAFIVMRHTGENESRNMSSEMAGLREFLKQRVPEYMIPAELIGMDKLPLTTNRKVDRKRLSASQQEHGDKTKKHIPPQTEQQKLLAEVWQEILNVERVGVEENFFEAGGHSLLLAQLSQRLTETLGREVSILELYRYPTISSFTTHLNAEGDDTTIYQDRAESRQRKHQAKQSVAKLRLSRRRSNATVLNPTAP